MDGRHREWQDVEIEDANVRLSRPLHPERMIAMASSKFSQFVTELQALCIKHGVTLSTSGYDSIQVWPLDPRDGPIYGGNIEDRTQDNPTATPPAAR